MVRATYLTPFLVLVCCCSAALASDVEITPSYRSLSPFQPLSVIATVHSDVRLKSLGYRLEIDPPSGDRACANAFFDQTIDLSGNIAPASIRIEPGILTPAGSRLMVCATVNYVDSNGMAAEQHARAVLPVEPPAGGGQYLAYKQAYVRAHILEVGRGLSDVAMKQFEPERDPPGLLDHSLTLTFQGRTHVYVPWLKSTQQSDGNSLPVGVIYGGDENPLLRGGLAMAAFALEYKATGSRETLRHAVRLLQWVSISEYQSSGFLLRTRHPGELRPDGHYFFASADEIAGVMLGMTYLCDALRSRPQTDSVLRAADAQTLAVLQGLVSRIAGQLSANAYFIVPPLGLPHRERQAGWSGLYVFEWYLRQAFKFVLGEDCPPRMSRGEVLLTLFTLPWGRSDRPDERAQALAAFWPNLSAKQRAVLVIQALTASLHLSQGLHLSQVNYFNLAMLMNFFQLSMFQPDNDATSVRVRDEMHRFLQNLLRSDANNYYAAALDRRFFGESDASSQAIEAVLKTSQRLSPAGDMKDWLGPNHNPDGAVGDAFVWENAPDQRVLKARSNYGVSTDINTHSCTDVFLHGAGLDFLLPTALLFDRGTGNAMLDVDMYSPAVSAAAVPQYLPGCTTMPLAPDGADIADTISGCATN